jgi:hypothetical protein
VPTILQGLITMIRTLPKMRTRRMGGVAYENTAPGGRAPWSFYFLFEFITSNPVPLIMILSC